MSIEFFTYVPVIKMKTEISELGIEFRCLHESYSPVCLL